MPSRSADARGTVITTPQTTGTASGIFLNANGLATNTHVHEDTHTNADAERDTNADRVILRRDKP